MHRLVGVRRDITVRVLQETFLGSNLQIAVLAYARCDFAATRANSLLHSGRHYRLIR